MGEKKFETVGVVENLLQGLETNTLPSMDIVEAFQRISFTPEEELHFLESVWALVREAEQDTSSLSRIFGVFMDCWLPRVSDASLRRLLALWADTQDRDLKLFVSGLIAWEKAAAADVSPHFQAGIVVAAELGLLRLAQLEQGLRPSEFSRPVAPLTAYLSSVANTNALEVRLCLLRYFTFLGTYGTEGAILDRLLGRFGYTSLSQVLVLLSERKTSAAAFEYLMEQIPLLLQRFKVSQPLLHATLKSFMLKEPEMATVLLRRICSRLRRSDEVDLRRSMGNHLKALSVVASSVGRRALVWDLFALLEEVTGIDERNETIRYMISETELTQEMRLFLRDLSAGSCRAKHGMKVALIKKVRGNKERRSRASLLPAQTSRSGLLFSHLNLLGAYDSVAS